jgi:hypothetical protein
MVVGHLAESNGVAGGVPFVLCRDPLFLQDQDTPATFELRALGLLAKTILGSRSVTEEAGGLWPEVTALRRLIEECDGDVTFHDPTTLREAVREWLVRFETLNPDSAFIAVIDNLEIAVAITNARLALEAVRDTVLSLPAVRWIICGTPGAVRGIVSSPRLYGRLFEPLTLQPVPSESAAEVLEQRYAVYAAAGLPDPPVPGLAFQLVYGLVGHDLRAALSLCEGFVTETWQDIQTADSDARAARFVGWVSRIALRHADALRVLPDHAQELLIDLGEFGGAWRSSETQLLGATSLEALRSMVAELADGAMVVVEDVLDEDTWSFRLSTQGHLAYASIQGFFEDGQVP